MDFHSDCVTTSSRWFSIAFVRVSILGCPLPGMGVVSCEFERYANFTHIFFHAVVSAVVSAFTRTCHF